ncbi:MAG: hypothetical protein QOE88_1426 [Verrucomicrobiota bacterium]|nr:hypothetical protein [Verrucomicrobiota bacterium]
MKRLKSQPLWLLDQTSFALFLHAANDEHKLLIASFRIRKDFFKACSKASPVRHRTSFGPVAESRCFRSRREPNGVSARHPKPATGFALTILARRENPPNGGCEQFRFVMENVHCGEPMPSIHPEEPRPISELWPSRQPCLLRHIRMADQPVEDAK